MSMISGVIGGVDTHADVHVAAAIDPNGAMLGTESFPADSVGYRQLTSWLCGFGRVVRVGVEGTGSYGVGLSRYLHGVGIEVVEVDRPNRQTRRRLGKSDPVDAEAAARAALSGSASVIPKRRNGAVEQIRVLMIAHRSAKTQRSQTLNQLRQVVMCGPDEVRARFKNRPQDGLITQAAAMRPRKGQDPVLYTTNMTIRGLALRIENLDNDKDVINADLRVLITDTAPSLLDLFGVGVVTAGTLLAAAGDNPERLRTEGAWANLCGVAPIPTGSGKTSGRVRLNRGGNRQANAALHQIVIVRMSHDPRTRKYVQRRLEEGLSKREIMRCLKRYVARETYKHLPRST